MKKSSKNIICSITQLDSNEQKRLLHLFARLNEQLRVEILDSQKDTFHKLKFNYIEVENKKLSYCAFVLSIKEFQNNVNLDELRSIKFENQYKKIDVNEKLSTVVSVFIQLREKQNFTYRDIAKYLKKNHRIDVAHSTIFRFYNQIKDKTC
jgi:hypothetical protein